MKPAERVELTTLVRDLLSVDSVDIDTALTMKEMATSHYVAEYGFDHAKEAIEDLWDSAIEIGD